MKTYTLSAALIQGLHDYLKTRPYGEVHVLMNTLVTELKPQLDEKPQLVVNEGANEAKEATK